MDYERTIVCLASSRKTGGTCFAGREWSGGQPGAWIRPISYRPTRELHSREGLYDDGELPQLLDIVRVPLSGASPAPHQHENELISIGHRWARAGKALAADARRMVDMPATLWATGYSSTAGCNNRVPWGHADGRSLYLVAVDHVDLLVGAKAPPYADSKRAVRAEFTYLDVRYRMEVTDRHAERRYLDLSDGRYRQPCPLLCISLSDEYDGYHYKLVAGIIHPDLTPCPTSCTPLDTPATT